MSTKTNIIELNGKRYDALSGEFIGAASTASQNHHSSVERTPSTAKTVDGFTKPIGHHAASKAAHHMSAAKPLQRQHTPVMDIKRSPGHTVKAHKPEQAKTLMRHAVKKPTPQPKRLHKSVTRTDILAKTPDTFVAPKLSIRNIDAARLERAQRIAKHKLVTRFQTFKPATAAVTAHVQHAAQTIKTVAQTPVRMPAQLQPMYAASDITMPTRTTSPVPARAHKPSMDIFERALERANSHEQKLSPKAAVKAVRHHRKKPRFGKRTVSALAVSVAVLLTGTFFAYQNKTMITMRVAENRAGFNAQLPGHKPAGFAIGNLSYSPGTVAINYKSNDNRNFSLTQKASNWDSESLLDNYVASASNSYQAVEAGDKTIYVYGDNNATWINKGVWYQVTSEGALSTNQLVDLASSM